MHGWWNRPGGDWKNAAQACEFLDTAIHGARNALKHTQSLVNCLTSEHVQLSELGIRQRRG